eukprot:jgi/Botrbrau1/797/Bobra.0181s0050.1
MLLSYQMQLFNPLSHHLLNAAAFRYGLHLHWPHHFEAPYAGKIENLFQKGNAYKPGVTPLYLALQSEQLVPMYGLRWARYYWLPM